ncbi:hypothetical protein SARC_13145 [Sphaeroforma arctica JP610]|uniref:Uncharacterized protein n=1 Tax=Sphaeroforma arctica JP610 TaxID=667725 RepID=A0A0L0FC21_9EUKA|nr:hypothetical protein SARC_13145 [Sphaeroforma arctica JP610]KNC74305.1 hypothetical protein SARC_13145 [Sphaeroforma arctica JP610]|eukprot:XP_014148207.1 hypothetical protein SARC_13145 [Sphaeroforma arctica JP610]
MLAKANMELGKDGEDVSIENVDEDQPHVQMSFSITENQDSDDDEVDDQNNTEQSPVSLSPQRKVKPVIEEL